MQWFRFIVTHVFISSLEDNYENELVTCALAVQCQCSGGRPDASRLKCIFYVFCFN